MILAALAAAAIAAAPPGSTARAGDVHWLEVSGTITAGTADYVKRGVSDAAAAGATALVIELRTPGGVVDATRDIVMAELNSPVPVVVWVAPRGAQAASAGTFILLAANVAAMAPAANTGAAHPIGIGAPDFLPSPERETPVPSPTPREHRQETPPASPPSKEGGLPFRFRSDQEHLAQKIENDTLAWVEAIARQRGRNVDWARRAVLESASVTAERALEIGVIDLIAADREELLRKLDGRVVATAAGDRTIATGSAAVVARPMKWRERVFSFVADPTLLAILGTIVVLGIWVELNNPGMVFPAVAAGIALLLVLVGSRVVPINAGGMVLIAGGVLMLILEVKVTSYGLLTIGGIGAILLGLTILVDETTFTVPIAWSVVLPALATLIGVTVFLTWAAVRAMAETPRGDMRALYGRTARTLTALSPEGSVLIDGERWHAVADAPIAADQPVRVVASEGLTLKVASEKKETS